MAGLGFLIVVLYVIGKNHNLFGKTFVLRARFENVHGLLPGNSVRFAGIDAGSVKYVDVLNDTTIEVTLMVQTKMKKFIHKNAQFSIGTDNLIGNRIINIESGKAPAPEVAEGDVIWGEKGTDPDEMLRVLNKTNYDIAAIASELKNTLKRINKSKVIWQLLEDETLPLQIRGSLTKVQKASTYMNDAMRDIALIVEDVKSGKGSVGKLVRDSALALSVTEAVDKLKSIGTAGDSLVGQINTFVSTVDKEVNNGKGTVNALLKNEAIAQRLDQSLKNIEQDTQTFNELLEALKHNILFRGYFRKMEKQKKTNQEAKGKY
jgi:phospholipid/cholesterol/gamma-HCH transport system substrate-binding protein